MLDVSAFNQSGMFMGNPLPTLSSPPGGLSGQGAMASVQGGAQAGNPYLDRTGVTPVNAPGAPAVGTPGASGPSPDYDPYLSRGGPILTDDQLTEYANWMNGKGPMPRSWQPGMPTPQVGGSGDPSVVDNPAHQQVGGRTWMQNATAANAALGRLQGTDISTDDGFAAGHSAARDLKAASEDLDRNVERMRNAAIDPSGAAAFDRVVAGLVAPYEAMRGVSPFWAKQISEWARENYRRPQRVQERRSDPAFGHLDDDMKRGLRASGMSRELISAFRAAQADQRASARGRPSDPDAQKNYDDALDRASAAIANSGGMGTGETDPAKIREWIKSGLAAPAPGERRGRDPKQHLQHQVQAMQKIADRTLARMGKNSDLALALEKYKDGIIHGASDPAARSSIRGMLGKHLDRLGKSGPGNFDQSEFDDRFFQAVADSTMRHHERQQSVDPKGFAAFESIKAGQPISPEMLDGISSYWRKHIAIAMRNRPATGVAPTTPSPTQPGATP